MRTRQRNHQPAVRNRDVRRAPAGAFALALWIASSACASAGPGGASPWGRQTKTASAASTDLSIEVQNQHLLAVQVWVQWPGERRFLGDVPAGTANTFRVPAAMTERFESLQLYADPVGSVDDVLTGPIKIGNGHRIEWRLEKVLANSRARVM